MRVTAADRVSRGYGEFFVRVDVFVGAENVLIPYPLSG